MLIRYLSNRETTRHATGTAETGHLASVFVLTFVTFNVPNHDQMLTTDQWLRLQSRLAVSETVNKI